MVSTVRDARVVASKAAVMQAVTELLGEKGPAGVTIEAVLSRSGVARATLYRHWPTRRALMVDGLRTIMKPPPLPPREGTLVERLHKFVGGMARQFSNERMASVMPMLLDAGRRDPDLSEHMAGLEKARRQPLIDIVTDGIASGHLREGTDPAIAHAQLVGPLLFRRMISGETITPEFCDRLVADYLAVNQPSPQPSV